MPKAARKVNVIRSIPPDMTIRVKTSNRTRTKAGRATSTHVKTTLNILEPDPPSTPSGLPDLYPENPLSNDESDGEPEVSADARTRKGSSKAVSVSFHPSCVP